MVACMYEDIYEAFIESVAGNNPHVQKKSKLKKSTFVEIKSKVFFFINARLIDGGMLEIHDCCS